MPIWRLMPVDLEDPSWQGSSHRGPAIVRAPDEAAAREVAEAAFATKMRFVPGTGTPVPPWKRPQLVAARIIERSVYPLDGPTEVLEPSFQRDLPRRPRRQSP
jgi:hypothetical protein